MIRTHNLVHSPLFIFLFFGATKLFRAILMQIVAAIFSAILVAICCGYSLDDFYLSKLHILTHRTLNRSTFDLALYHNIRIMYWNTRVSINFEMSFWCHCFDQKTNKNIVRISALKVFKASLGLPGSFLGLPGDLVSNIINKEAYRSHQGSYRNFQGRNPYNIFVNILQHFILVVLFFLCHEQVILSWVQNYENTS